MRARTSIVMALALVLCSTPAGAQTSEAPSGTEDAAASQAVGEPATDSGAGDLWVHQAGVLTRVSGETGEVLDVTTVSTTACLLESSWPSFVRPDGGAVWLQGTSSADQETADHCFVRVPLTGADVTTYSLLPPQGKEYFLHSDAGIASVGEDLLVVADLIDRGGPSDLFERALFRVAADGSIRRLQDSVIAIAPSPAGPIGSFIQGKKRNGKPRHGTFDPDTERLVARGGLKKTNAIMPSELTLGVDGVVSNHSQFGSPIIIIDPAMNRVIGKVKAPKRAATIWQAAPSPDGTWIHGTLKNRKDFLQYGSIDAGKSKAVDACEGLATPCRAMIAAVTEDAVWVQAGPYDEKRGTWVFEDATYRRYAPGETIPSLDVPASDILQPVAYDWLE